MIYGVKIGTMKESVARWLMRFSRKGFVYFGHGVASVKQDDYVEKLHIQEDDFLELVHFWRRMGVDFLSMHDLWRLRCNGFKGQRPWLHFTFDDGYRNNLTTLLPIMETYNIPFTVFVSTGLIEAKERMPSFYIRCAFQHASNECLDQFVRLNSLTFDKGLTRQQLADKVVHLYKYLPYGEGHLLLKSIRHMLSKEQWSNLYQKYENDKLLSLDEMKQLSAHPLVHLGAHGSRHLIHHKQQPAQLIAEELTEPLQYVNNHPLTFAYPNGTKLDYSNGSKKMLIKQDYQLSFTTVADFVTQGKDPLSIPRFHLTPKGNWLVRKWFYGFG